MQYVNVGVTLQIAPRVTSDGFVTSHVFCVVSSVTGTSQGYPTISQREAETSATVRDGETFVIGGLTEENSTRDQEQGARHGDIPLAGDLLHLTQGSKSKTELYIVVTPHIVKRNDTTQRAAAGRRQLAQRRFAQALQPRGAGGDSRDPARRASASRVSAKWPAIAMRAAP